MPKNALRGLSVILGMLFLLGCTATKNVEVRRYVEVKDRIDQNMEEGNAGFLMGTPQPEDRSNIRKTRKIYVVEVSKGVDEETEEVMVEDNEALKQAPDYEEEEMDDTDYEMDYDLDELTSEQDMRTAPLTDKAMKTPSSMVEYTVQKDDTLQKISKKFYDSYSKWPRIYEANKDVISDPDRIKPGITLQIPKD